MMGRLRTWAARSTEMLDDPATDDHTVVASLRDIARINRAFGGSAAALARLDEFFAQAPRGSAITLLDVGTGTGDLPRAAATRAAARGLELRLVGIEIHRAAAAQARDGGMAAVVAEGRRLPLRERSVDIVLCAKLLHHLPGEAGRTLLREMDRVARIGVVVADIRRSMVAAAGLWLVSFPMGLHPATRHDGVISVFRGFSAEELRQACADAGIAASVRRHPGWCLTAAWYPNGRRA